MIHLSSPIPTLLGLSLISAVSWAEFPAIYNSEPGDPNPIPAQEALEKFKLPEGFTATLFAAEPEIQNPIAASWDRHGRLWVAENYTYAERQKRFAMELNDRLIVLEDKDNDGLAESRKVFTDQVKMLTSVETGHGGVWLMCPPQLLFIPDANEDAVPDGPPQVVLDGFDVSKDNYHNYANGLRWGPDGWLYGRCGHSCPARPGAPGTPESDRPSMKGGIWRYHPQRKTVEVVLHGSVNPWGHDWNAQGEGFFTNTVIGHLWHIIAGAHLIETNGSVSTNADVYERMDMIADHYHFDTKGKWQDSRDGAANDLGGGHAHIGAMIYQDDQWPERFRDRLFTLNMHGRRANVERLERSGSGYVGKHEPDVFLSDDLWYRGIDITQGPDGSAFILDWSDTGECHDHTGVHRTSGRIFKIRYGNPAKPDLSDLQAISPAGVERLIRNPNVWYERQLRIQLAATKPSAEVSQKLVEIATDGNRPTVERLRAIWTAYASRSTPPGPMELTDDHLTNLLKEKDEHLRVWGIRLLTDTWSIDTLLGTQLPVKSGKSPVAGSRFIADLNAMASDPSGLVKLQLASTLQRLPLENRAMLAGALAADKEYANDHQLPHLIWYGMLPVLRNDPAQAVKLAATASSPKLVKWCARFLASRSDKSPAPFAELLGTSLSPASRHAVMEGISEAFTGISQAPEPQNWRAFASAVQEPESASLVQKLSILFGDTETLNGLRKLVSDKGAKISDRQAALDILIDSKVSGLRELCESVLTIPALNANAIRGLALSEDPAVARLLVANFDRFEPIPQAHLIDVLTGRPDWAAVLLDEIAAGRIPKTALPAFSARRIVALKNETLTKKLTEVWGSLGSSASDKTKAIADLKKQLTPETLAAADLKNGKQLFAGICGACHTLYGAGGRIGPDLTGSGRSNLDYLLENIVDPSAVVSADHRITTVTLQDGRVISGTIGAKTDRTMTLKSPAGDTTLEISTITKQESTATSLMPEGLLTAFQADQVRDLIAYLMHQGQVD